MFIISEIEATLLLYSTLWKIVRVEFCQLALFKAPLNSANNFFSRTFPIQNFTIGKIKNLEDVSTDIIRKY